MLQCSKCGAQNADTAKFCANCGALLQGQQSSSPAQPVNTGTRVSFVAGDGKTYTGTIKAINDDQYNIKYDASNFDVWLKRNQFTPLGESTRSPAYTPASNPNVTYTKTAASVAGRTSSPLFITHLGFWGSIMIIIGFFTPWLYISNGTVTGYKILSSAKGILQDTNNDKLMVLTLVAIAVILFSALIGLFYTITGAGRPLFLLFKILPFLTIIAFIAYIIVKIQQNTGDVDIPVDASVWKVLGVGIYLTLVGSFVLAISRSRK